MKIKIYQIRKSLDLSLSLSLNNNLINILIRKEYYIILVF